MRPRQDSSLPRIEDAPDSTPSSGLRSVSSLDPIEDDLPAAIGEVVAGKFRVDRVIGRGGMGIVLAATHLDLGEPVALKFLRRAVLGDPEAVGRFTHEARATARLKSQYVARVLDVGVLRDVPYIVMEHLVGQDLSRALASEGVLPIASAAEYALQACEALAEAHARGLVHRDVKPENLFLVDDHGGRYVKVLDFGIAKACSTSTLANVRTGRIMGSPCYMSPEQLRATADVDLRADIWSLGASLFELLAGAPPFDGTRPLTALVVSILSEPPRSLRALRPDVPLGLEQVVLRCLERDPARRYGNAGELAVALVPYAGRSGRLAAERAVQLTRAAGVASNPRLEVPTSLAPSSQPELARTALDLNPPDSKNAPWSTGGTGGELAIATAPRAPRRWPFVLAAAAGFAAAAISMLRPAAIAPAQASGASATIAIVAPTPGSIGPSMHTETTPPAAGANVGLGADARSHGPRSTASPARRTPRAAAGASPQPPPASAEAVGPFPLDIHMKR